MRSMPRPGAVWVTRTTRSASPYGSGFSTTSSNTEKMAVLAPIPSAMVAIATAAKPGVRRTARNANRASCQTVIVIRTMLGSPRPPGARPRRWPRRRSRTYQRTVAAAANQYHRCAPTAVKRRATCAYRSRMSPSTPSRAWGSGMAEASHRSARRGGFTVPPRPIRSLPRA